MNATPITKPHSFPTYVSVTETIVIPCTRCGRTNDDVPCTWPSGVHNIKITRRTRIVLASPEESIKEFPINRKCDSCGEYLYTNNPFSAYISPDGIEFIHDVCP